VKLHRLVLTNYRGITHREIEFPDRGVVIVSGANEIGKSSMIEALDLLFEHKDRSTRKEVKAVKPTHADVGAEVAAEISTGPYRFVYRKRFHRRCETELTVLAPIREQLTGDEAHERVRAMLAETVDTCLWQAQRVLQSASTADVDLSGCDALSRALDVAAGEAAEASGTELSGAEPLLIDRVEAEYLRYFTRTGKATGEWLAATKRLAAADAEVARCAAAMAEVDEAVQRHATLTEQLSEVAAEHASAAERLTAARAAADKVAELTRQVKEAGLVADTAHARHAAAAQAVADRWRMRTDIDERAAAITELRAAAAEADEALAAAVDVRDAADATAATARAAVETAQSRVAAARSVVDRLAERDEADRLAARVAKIVAAKQELDSVSAELAGIALTAQDMSAIEKAQAAVDAAAGQVESVAGRVDLVAIAPIELQVDGETVALDAGESWSTSVSAETEVVLPGILAVRLSAGNPAAQTQARLDAARQVLQTALEAAGVAGIDAARALDQRRQRLVADRDRHRATVDALLGDDSLDALQARLTELTQRQPADLTDVDAATARAELDTAGAVLQQAIVDAETHRKVAEAAAKKLGECEIRAATARQKLVPAEAELAGARERLASQREQTSDEELAVRAAAAEEDKTRAETLLAELTAELTDANPDAVAAELRDAERQSEALQRRRTEVADALREVSTQLKVYGTEGRQDQLDAAKTERQHAEAEHLRVQRRARAAELLRSVLIRHRDATRQRYVEPFRREVERLGRVVFGPSFEVEVDSELRIRSRTLAGRTVPYESLSGGAKEQLGIVARLASAALVAKEDNVPVVIDDALGFTDADRLVKMGEVFNSVGGDGQVIVLTCTPQRYASVAGAHRIELAA